MTLVFKKPDPLQAALKTGTLKIYTGAPGEEPEQIAEIDLSKVGPPIDITAQGYEVVAVWYEANVEQDPEITSEFKITDDDIGRVAISDSTWIEGFDDAWKVDELEWTITEKRGENYFATADRSGDTELATFDPAGYAEDCTIFDAFIQLIKWKDAQ